MKSFPYLLGFFILFFISQVISSAESSASSSSSISSSSPSRVRVVKVRKSKLDKRQIGSNRGFAENNQNNDGGYDSQLRRPQDNPYNAGNRNVDYPLRDNNANQNQLHRRQSGGSSPSNTRQLNNRQNTQKSASDFDDGSYREEYSDSGDTGIPGDAGTDYPIHASLPKTNFDCKQQQWPGYYADVESRCQVFWICQKNKADAFLCPNGTVFNQQVFVCDWWFNVDCNASPEFYSRNQYIYAGAGIDLFGNPIQKSNNAGTSSNNNNADPINNNRFTAGNPASSSRRTNTNLQHAPTTIIPFINSNNNDFINQESASSSRNSYNRRAIDSNNGGKKTFDSTVKSFNDEEGFGGYSTRKSVDEIFATSTPILGSRTSFTVERERDSSRTNPTVTPTQFPTPYTRIFETTTRKYSAASEPQNQGRDRFSYSNSYSKPAGESTSSPIPRTSNAGGYTSKLTHDIVNLPSTRDDDAISPKDALRILSEIIANGAGGPSRTTNPNRPQSSSRNERKVSHSTYAKQLSSTTPISVSDSKKGESGYLPKVTVIGKQGATQIATPSTTPRVYADDYSFGSTPPKKNFSVANSERFAFSASTNNFHSPTTPRYDDVSLANQGQTTESKTVSSGSDRHRNFNDFHYDTNRHTYEPMTIVVDKQRKPTTTTPIPPNYYLDDFQSTGGQEITDADYNNNLNDEDEDNLFDFKFAKTVVPPSTTTTTTQRPQIFSSARATSTYFGLDEPVAEETTEARKNYLAPTTFRPSFSETIRKIRIGSSSMIGTTPKPSASSTTTQEPLSFLETPNNYDFDSHSFPTTTISPTFGRKTRSGRKRSTGSSAANWTNYFYNN